jgi:hypothetical protein
VSHQRVCLARWQTHLFFRVWYIKHTKRGFYTLFSFVLQNCCIFLGIDRYGTVRGNIDVFSLWKMNPFWLVLSFVVLGFCWFPCVFGLSPRLARLATLHGPSKKTVDCRLERGRNHLYCVYILLCNGTREHIFSTTVTCLFFFFPSFFRWRGCYFLYCPSESYYCDVSNDGSPNGAPSCSIVAISSLILCFGLMYITVFVVVVVFVDSTDIKKLKSQVRILEKGRMGWCIRLVIDKLKKLLH